MGYNEAFREIVLNPLRDNEAVNRKVREYLVQWQEFRSQQPVEEQKFWSFDYYIRDQILQRAQTSCTTKTLSLLYSYAYMPCHVDGNKAVIKRERDTFFEPFIYRKPTNVLIIDVGCGPMTACLALADDQQDRNADTRLNLDYVGFDIQPRMTDIALEFGRRKNQNDLFGENFRWCYPDGKNTLWIEQVRNSVKQNGTLVFYFSYFWGQEGVENDIAIWVDRVKRIALQAKAHDTFIAYLNKDMNG